MVTIHFRHAWLCATRTREAVTGRSNGQAVRFHGAWRLLRPNGRPERARWKPPNGPAVVAPRPCFEPIIGGTAIIQCAVTPCEAYRDVPPQSVGSDSSSRSGYGRETSLVRPHGRTSSKPPRDMSDQPNEKSNTKDSPKTECSRITAWASPNDLTLIHTCVLYICMVPTYRA